MPEPLRAQASNKAPDFQLLENVSTFVKTDFIERGRAKVWPLFTFAESLSANVAKPLQRRGVPRRSRER